jgi:hypothetical protein
MDGVTEGGGRVNSVGSRGDVRYPHSFHQYTTLSKPSRQRWHNKRFPPLRDNTGKHSLPPALLDNSGKHSVDTQRLLGKAYNNTDSDTFSVCPAEGL